VGLVFGQRRRIEGEEGRLVTRGAAPFALSFPGSMRRVT
jgi:hypothetical protein